MLVSMKKVFDHAFGKRIIDVNPAFGIDLKALMGKRPPVRKRLMLTEGELRALLPGIDDKIGRGNGPMLHVLLATWVRTNELVMAKKALVDVRRGSWYVQEEAVKTRDGFLVPLVPIVTAWVKELNALSGDSEWRLPVRIGKRRNRLGETHVGNTTLWAAIARGFERSRLTMPYFTPHDTRSTAKSHMRNMGISKEISELALNHALKGMEGIYDVREEIPERREAMELWAQFIADCSKGGESNVIPMNRKAG